MLLYCLVFLAFASNSVVVTGQVSSPVLSGQVEESLVEKTSQSQEKEVRTIRKMNKQAMPASRHPLKFRGVSNNVPDGAIKSINPRRNPRVAKESAEPAPVFENAYEKAFYGANQAYQSLMSHPNKNQEQLQELERLRSKIALMIEFFESEKNCKD